MKKLQNDFTTKQQSEKVLALGVPRLSANFYYDDENEVRIVKDPEFELQSKGYFPCWSVGRLMEIYHICISNTTIYGWSYHEDVDGNYIDYIIQEYVDALKYEELDFSKLGE